MLCFRRAVERLQKQQSQELGSAVGSHVARLSPTPVAARLGSGQLSESPPLGLQLVVAMARVATPAPWEVRGINSCLR